MFHIIIIIAFIGNLIISFIGARILLKQWYFSERRFYTDLPFLLGISFIVVFCDIVDSTLGFILNYPPNIISSIITSTNMILLLGVMLITILDLWFEDKKRKIRLIVIISFTVALEMLSILFLTSEFETIISLLNLGLVLPVLFVFGFTFLQCYKQKRLPNINPLWVGIGFLISGVSFTLKSIIFFLFEPISYVFPAYIFICYFMDILAYTFAIYGFTHKAPY